MQQQNKTCMKSAIKTYLFLTTLLTGSFGFAQTNNYSIENNQMEATLTTNKETIRSLYENIMNNRKFDLLNLVVSEDYVNAQGEKGVEAFKKGIMAVITAFPDARWTLTEMIAEGNKVFVKQRVEGTHKGAFQYISPTNRTISNDGMVIYEFRNAKLIGHQIQTDRFAFFQQLGVLPADFPPAPLQHENNVYFIDQFKIPKHAVTEFLQRMMYNRNFIKTLPGFIKDEVFSQEDTNGNLNLMTIAVWENQHYLDKAKQLVQAEYKKINFNPTAFTDRLGITMERAVYKNYTP